MKRSITPCKLSLCSKSQNRQFPPGNLFPIRLRRYSKTNCDLSLTSVSLMPTSPRPNFFSLTPRTITRLRCRRCPRFWATLPNNQFDLVDTDTELKPPPDAVSQLQDEAFSNRPEIASQGFENQAAQHFQKAEHDLLLPSIEALGVVGRTPYSNSIAGVSPFTSWYGAIGVNVNIPIFNGFLYPARSREAGFRAQAADQQLRDLKDRIANDVRTSWLSAITAYNRIGVTQQYVDQANLAVDLSQTRYSLGAQFDRGTQPGTTDTNRSTNPVRCREVSIPHSRVGPPVPDRGAIEHE